MEKFPLYLDGKPSNLISRKSLPSFQKQPFTGKHLHRSFFLIKFRFFRPATLLKSNSNKGVFLLILQNIKNRFSHRTPPVAASALHH